MKILTNGKVLVVRSGSLWEQSRWLYDVSVRMNEQLVRAAQQRTGEDGAVAEEAPKNLRTKDSDAGAMGDAG